MSEHLDIERAVAQHIESVGVSPPSDAFYDGLFTRAGRTRQRPRWLAMLKEPPMRYRSRVAFGSPIARVTAFAAITMLMTILGAGALVVGAQSPSPAPPSIAPEPLDPMGASYWTGHFEGTGGTFGVQSERTGYTEDLGGTAIGQVTADDPRMAGTMTETNNVHIAPSRKPGEADVYVTNGTVRIENEEGAWVGTFTAWSSGSWFQGFGEEWHVMEGQGAYEGLTAVFRYESTGSTFEGVILPSELPVLPDPIAPPTE
jgi:hypothetical protein